jgi:ribosomal protein S12 methylthiotransferase accessory factor
MDIEVLFEDNMKVNARVGKHVLKTDQPERSGGDDTAPSPFEYFLASIGTCAGIYVKRFCDQRGIDPSNIRIVQKHNYNLKTHLIDKIDIEIKLPDDFPEKYRSAIIKVANQCAVKKHLQTPPEIEVEVGI